MLAQLRAHNAQVSEFQQRIRDHLADEAFDERIEAFMRRAARRVAAGAQVIEAKRSAPMEGEFSLETHAAYKEYLALSEDHWNAFCKTHGISKDELHKSIAKMLDDKPKQGCGMGFNANYGGAIMIRYMLAGWDFDKFVDACKDWAEEHQDEEQDDSDDDNNVAEGKTSSRRSRESKTDRRRSAK